MENTSKVFHRTDDQENSVVRQKLSSKESLVLYVALDQEFIGIMDLLVTEVTVC